MDFRLLKRSKTCVMTLLPPTPMPVSQCLAQIADHHVTKLLKSWDQQCAAQEKPTRDVAHVVPIGPGCRGTLQPSGEDMCAGRACSDCF